MPPILLRPIMPSETDDTKISKKKLREFHHLASFALKQITNHTKPALANIILIVPYTFFPCQNIKLFMMIPLICHSVLPASAGTSATSTLFPIFASEEIGTHP